MDLGPAAKPGIAWLGRRYAAPLASLLGPAGFTSFALGLALRATAAQRWAAHLSFFFWPSSSAANFMRVSTLIYILLRSNAIIGLGMDRGAAQPQTQVFERSEKTAEPSEQRATT